MKEESPKDEREPLYALIGTEDLTEVRKHLIRYTSATFPNLSYDTIEDIVSETFLETHKKTETIKFLNSYLRKVAFRKAVEIQKQNFHQIPLTEEALETNVTLLDFNLENVLAQSVLRVAVSSFTRQEALVYQALLAKEKVDITAQKLEISKSRIYSLHKQIERKIYEQLLLNHQKSAKFHPR